MAMEGNFFEGEAHFVSEEDVRVEGKWKSVSTPAAVSVNNSGCFDCNICLDSAHDPVVTLCGHLYCWACIYKWVHVQSSYLEDDQPQPNCPVCKANVSLYSVVPLYGRGMTSSESDSKKAPLETGIPRRPPSALNALITNSLDQNQQFHQNFFQPESRSFRHQQYFPDPYGAMTSSTLSSTTMSSIFNPVIGMFGEPIFARIFGTSQMSLLASPYPNSNPLQGSNNPRIRRQGMQLEKSLNRVTIFLLCCIILCLLLF